MYRMYAVLWIRGQFTRMYLLDFDLKDGLWSVMFVLDHSIIVALPMCAGLMFCLMDDYPYFNHEKMNVQLKSHLYHMCLQPNLWTTLSTILSHLYLMTTSKDCLRSRKTVMIIGRLHFPSGNNAHFTEQSSHHSSHCCWFDANLRRYPPKRKHFLDFAEAVRSQACWNRTDCWK